MNNKIMDKEQKERHDKAWKLLDEKGLKLGQKMMVRSAFAGMKSDENPFIKIHYKLGSGSEVEYYSSTHSKIKSLMFKTENEVVLANALYLNMSDITFTNEEFILCLKATFRILRYDGEWT